jgi:hypothetical protein
LVSYGKSTKKWYQFVLWTQSLPELPDEIKAGAQDRYDHAMSPYLVIYNDIHPKIKEKNKEGCLYTNIDTYPSHVKDMQKRRSKRIKRHSPSKSVFFTYAVAMLWMNAILISIGC